MNNSYDDILLNYYYFDFFDSNGERNKRTIENGHIFSRQAKRHQFIVVHTVAKNCGCG